jgi:hypothetical protein
VQSLYLYGNYISMPTHTLPTANADVSRADVIEAELLGMGFVSVDARGGLDDERALKVAKLASPIMDWHYEAARAAGHVGRRKVVTADKLRRQ